MSVPERMLHRSGLGQPAPAPARRDTLTNRARDRLRTVFTIDDPSGKLHAAWLVKEQLYALLSTGFLADAAVGR